MTVSRQATPPSRRVKPTGLVRGILHVPDLLYRWHLGWLLGHRFLLLTHRGRKSGLVRRTVLEVVAYDPATRESVVLSGLGPAADWYRNLEAEPAIMVQTGRRRYPPRQRLLTPAEAAAVATEFGRRHPLEARIATRVLSRLGWSAGDERPTWRELSEGIPMVAFAPRD